MKFLETIFQISRKYLLKLSLTQIWPQGLDLLTSMTEINYLIFVKITFLSIGLKLRRNSVGNFHANKHRGSDEEIFFLIVKTRQTQCDLIIPGSGWYYWPITAPGHPPYCWLSSPLVQPTDENNSASDGMISRYSLEVIKILYRHRDFVLGREEQTVPHLAGVLRVSRLGSGVVVVVLQSCLHFCLVQTGNNFVDDVLERLIGPATNRLSWNLVKHNNLFMLLKISDCHSLN